MMQTVIFILSLNYVLFIYKIGVNLLKVELCIVHVYGWGNTLVSFFYQIEYVSYITDSLPTK